MANKRKFKKSVEAATALLCNEMMLEAAMCKDETRRNEIEDLVVKLLAAYDVALIQANVQFDKSPKAFASVTEYHKERRNFYRKMFERIAVDYNKVMNETIEKFKSLLNAEK